MTISEQQAKRAFFAITGGLLALLLLRAITGLAADADLLFDRVVYIGLEVAGAGAAVVRAVRRRPQRLAWACIGAGLFAFAGGDIVWMAVEGDLPYPSVADALYLAFYPLVCAGMALLLARGRDHVATRLWMDGAIGGLAVSAAVVLLLFDPIVHATDGTRTQIAVNLAYPIADLVVFCFVLTAFATQGWRPGRGWMLLGLGAALNAVADTAYLYQDALGTFREGSIVDALWPAALLMCGWAALTHWREVPLERRFGRSTFALPTVFSTIALGVLVAGQFHAISPLAAALATAALAAATLRTTLTFRQNMRLLTATRHEALTDGLTGLPNRRRLMRDLEHAVRAGRRGQTSTLAFFDLDGFKPYNDGFGHAAGDILLDRLAGRLAATVREHGIAYRLGGDEFCVLLDGAFAQDAELLRRCAAALSEQGEGFRVGSSYGSAVIPEEADAATHALQLADQRMYLAKDSKRPSSRRQACDVLLQVLREREPDLHEHLHGVASLAAGVARQLELTAEQIDEVTRAAELHDVGKIAIPDEILHKPAPLDAAEWELMRQHTILGDRILSAAPAMRPVARIVRSSHERWDGSGYPDGLAGEAIPLGARIVAVCDAFHAMTSVRPYQAKIDPEAALAELARCAGAQFDPAVVAVFTALVRTGAGSAAADPTPTPLPLPTPAP